MKFLVVGDVHGCSHQLKALLDREKLHRDREVVFLGDFVDVGPDSRGVIDLLLEFGSGRADAVFLQGNHDYGLVSYLRSGDFATLAQAGGIATVRSYCGGVKGDVRAALARALPDAHLNFLQGLRPFFETESYLFSHCGYAPESPLDRSPEAMVLRSHQGLFERKPPLPKLAVCGHYFQRTHEPFISERVICLDTGCGVLEGPLSALLLPEVQVVQISTDLTVSFSEQRLGRATGAPRREGS